MKIFTDERITELDDAFIQYTKVMFNGKKCKVKSKSVIDNMELIMIFDIKPNFIYFYELVEV